MKILLPEEANVAALLLEQNAEMNASKPSERPKSTQVISVRRVLSYLLFIIGTALYLLPFMRLLLQGTDEGELIGGAVRIVHGQVFARDFFEIVGPGTFYWQALFFKFFGITFAATRICLFISSLGIAILMFFLSRRLCKQYVWLPVALLFATLFGALWPTISHHVDSTFFALLAIACMVLWQDRRRGYLLVCAGVLCAADTCFLQPKGLLILLSLVLWLWIQLWRQGTFRPAVSLLLSGFCGFLLIVVAYFWSRGALRDLVFVNILVPYRHYSSSNQVPYAQDIFNRYWFSWPGKWTVGVAALLIAPFLFVATLPAWIFGLGARYNWRGARPEVLLYFLSGWALLLSELHRKDIYHLVFGSPLLIILCIYFLTEYKAKIPQLCLQLLAVCTCCLAGFNFVLVLTAHSVRTRVGTVAMFRDDPVLGFLNERVAIGEKFFAYPYCPMYYFLSATENPTAFSVLVYNASTPAQFREVTQVLDREKIRYVLWDTNFVTKVAPHFFPLPKGRSPDKLIMEPYLESHYRSIRSSDGVQLMERKDDIQRH